MTRIEQARTNMVNVIRMYAPIHTDIAADARAAVDKAMDELQAAAIAEAKAPAAPPPVPPTASPPPPVAHGEGLPPVTEPVLPTGPIPEVVPKKASRSK